MLYALHNQQNLDLAAISRKVFQNQILKSTSMSAAQILINQGRVEGELTGQIRLLQKLMNVPIAPHESLENMSTADLQLYFEKLETQYNAAYKK